ncbi:phospholipase A2 inhibitor gamma subunit B-like [Dendropsophus ebraccatus]|uniref:phospholipase A2 inhibitor gamma subunit B-like n=1 Tax=Dendropsophus ebraccatus TaxID=150705 RepID=UPI0038313B28
MKTHVQCCSGDDCNTDDYQMPPQPEERNGKTCTSCFGEGMKECESDRKVTCLNKEDKCVDFFGRFKDPDQIIQEHNFKGCISPVACTLKFEGLIGLEEIQTDRFDCE